MNENKVPTPADKNVLGADLKNVDLSQCQLCKQGRPATIEYKRLVGEGKDARYQSISCCHICSAKGEKAVWVDYDKQNK